MGLRGDKTFFIDKIVLINTNITRGPQGESVMALFDIF